MLSCPCKLCTTDTGRRPGCHDSCADYRSWKADREEAKRREAMENVYIASSRCALGDKPLSLKHFETNKSHKAKVRR